MDPPTNTASSSRSAAVAAAERSQKPSTSGPRRANRAQPWRAHWPPKTTENLSAAYGFKKGETVRIYGN